jgi:hypothetical protein
MKKKIYTMLATGAVLGTVALPGLAFAEEKPPPPTKSPCFDIQLEDPPSTNKVSLCHFTGGTNFVLNSPSISSFEPHASHHGDCYKFTGEAQVCVL